MKRQIKLMMLSAIAFLLVVAVAASSRPNTSLTTACCCGKDHCPITKKVDKTNPTKGDDYSCCKNNTCAMNKRDGSEKPHSTSTGKCEGCEMKSKKTKGEHHSMSGTESMAHGKNCDCPCCKKKDADTKASNTEVVTLASMSY